MAAYTSSQAGNWSNASTWGGSGPPGNGDTATVDHDVTVDSNTTVGTSPSDQTTVVLTISSGATLTVATNITLIVRGNVYATGNGTDACLYLTAGSILEFDASQAGTPSTPYVFDLGRAWVGPGILNATGSSGSHVTIRSNAGGGNGHFACTNGPVQYTCGYTDFQDIGDTSNDAITLSAAASTDDEFTNCTFDGCGRVRYSAGASASSGWTFSDCVWSNVNAADGVNGLPCPLLLISAGGPITATRTMIRCVFPEGTQPQISNRGGEEYSYCFFGEAFTTQAQSGAWGLFDKNFVRITEAFGITLNGDVSNCYIFADGNALENIHFTNLSSDVDYGIDVTYTIFEANNQDSNGDGIIIGGGSTTSGLVFNFSYNIVLPNESGDAPCSLVTLPGAAGGFIAHAALYHNTAVVGYQSMLMVSDGGATAGYVDAFKSNLTWDSGVTYAPQDFGPYHIHDFGAGREDLVDPAGVTHNCGYSLEAGSEGGGFDCPMSTSVGTGNISADPQFVDSTRNLSKWAVSQGSGGSTKAQKEGHAFGYLRGDITLIDDLLTYIRAGFAPTNVALDGTAHDAGDIGAVAYTSGADVTAPTLTSATVGTSGDTLTLVLDEAVSAGSGGNGGLTISASGGAVTATYASGGGTDTLVYNLSRPIALGETLTCDYTQPGDGLEDAAGNDLATFADAAVTNNSTYEPPVLELPGGNGISIGLGMGIGL